MPLLTHTCYRQSAVAAILAALAIETLRTPAQQLKFMKSHLTIFQLRQKVAEIEQNQNWQRKILIFPLLLYVIKEHWNQLLSSPSVVQATQYGRVKLLSAAVQFNGNKES